MPVAFSKPMLTADVGDVGKPVNFSASPFVISFAMVLSELSSASVCASDVDGTASSAAASNRLASFKVLSMVVPPASGLRLFCF